MKRYQAFILALLITTLIAMNFYFFSNINYNKREVFVSRVIDGDTFVSLSGETFRLVNINTPEKSQPGFLEAKDYLSLLENKTVEVEDLGQDKYDRTLARVFTNKYINLEIIKKGLGKKYLVNSHELKEFETAEKNAIKNSIGLWKKSKKYGCLELNINYEKEIIQIKSKCGELFLKDWSITDESRKKYKFKDLSIKKINLHTFQGEDNATDIFWNLKQNVWNNNRDTVYIFDEEQKIVHYESYGY